MSEASRPSAPCRVCGGRDVETAGHVQYFVGFDWPVFDCRSCGCRLTPHDDAAYDVLHTTAAIPHYGDYRDIATLCKKYFDGGDANALRAYLSRWTKYRFVIDAVESLPASARILEFGCSRGYLTSYSILAKRQVLGVDVSSVAVESAARMFGDNFCLPGSPRIEEHAPYDLIYHVGMIGCVADPIGLNRRALELLRPGGTILFNAPNRNALWARDQLWFDSAPPPDLVTMFPPGFWKNHLYPQATVSETEETLGADQSLAIRLRRMFGIRWQPPAARLISEASRADVAAPASPAPWRLFERSVLKAARVLHLSSAVARWPTEYGLLIKATKSPND